MKRKDKFYTDEQKEIMNFGKILVVLIVIIGALYLFTVYVVNKEESYKRTNTKGKIQYDSIIIGSMLNRSEDEYYVLITDSTDMSDALLTNKLVDYRSNGNHLPIYTADLSNELNKNFIGEKTSYINDNIEDFKVKGSALVKVKNGKIVKLIEDDQEILNEL